MVERKLLTACVEGLELPIDEEIGVGWELVEGEVDGRGDEGGGGVAVFEERAVGGARVGVESSLAEGDGAVQRFDLGDVTGGVDIDLKVDGSLDAGGFGLGGVRDCGDGEGLVLQG